MEWKFVKKTSIDNIRKVEYLTGFSIPEDLKRVILDCNSGYPTSSCYDTIVEQGKEIKKLLSFNEEDSENIYMFLNFYKETKLFPFADDSAGNLICLDKANVVLWNHETAEKTYIANSVTEFLSKLYEEG